MSLTPQILYITAELPSVRVHGGTIWTRQLIEMTRGTGAQVTILGYGPAGYAGEVSAGPPPARARAMAKELLHGLPVSMARWMSPAFRDRLLALLAGRRWDIIVINGLQMFWVRSLLGSARVIGVMHQVESKLYNELAARSSLPKRAIYSREARLMGTLERRLGDFDALWCISEQDSNHFRHEYGAPSVCVPPIAAVASHVPVDCQYQLGLLGNWLWEPNAIALQSFLTDVVPRLPGDWRIAVAGPTRLRTADFVRVEFLGAVPSAASFLGTCARIAVPSTSATGCNLKLIDAIASGRGVVADVAAEQLVGACPQHILFARNASEFADRLMICEPGSPDEITRWNSHRAEVGRAAIAETLCRAARN